ncbi:g-protein alpha subunit [Ancylostoma ceylanicum]|uniref:G-protein alpha subunit n=1 Tax=Ancylostoma ceylanicum TaxID=53326 RepID=A0A0D6LLW8_9BILA|nr:g-protein alpha subunit [Ancylostoma ceylanicum]
MGACESVESKAAREAVIISKKIDRELERKNNGNMEQKLLLLGPGESGKSTCLKQLKIMHANGYSEQEIQEKKFVVYMNIVQSMAALLDAMEVLGIPFDNNSMEIHGKLVRKVHASGCEFIDWGPELRSAVRELFFNELDRISKKNYKPSLLDILHTRVPTSGVVQFYFTMKGINFEVFDVGGQRSERRKWIHCFDNVNAVIYVAAISEYDQVLREDNKTNRLKEALLLFDGVVNNQYFKDVSVILFLNKKDLFAEKILYVSLKVCFDSYDAERDGTGYAASVAYIRRRFENALIKHSKKPYVHETCATDTNQVQVVINSVIDTIVQENLKDTGMI